jgi:hypothetical protein
MLPAAIPVLIAVGAGGCARAGLCLSLALFSPIVPPVARPAGPRNGGSAG